MAGTDGAPAFTRSRWSVMVSRDTPAQGSSISEFVDYPCGLGTAPPSFSHSSMAVRPGLTGPRPPPALTGQWRDPGITSGRPGAIGRNSFATPDWMALMITHPAPMIASETMTWFSMRASSCFRSGLSAASCDRPCSNRDAMMGWHWPGRQPCRYAIEAAESGSSELPARGRARSP